MSKRVSVRNVYVGTPSISGGTVVYADSRAKTDIIGQLANLTFQQEGDTSTGAARVMEFIQLIADVGASPDSSRTLVNNVYAMYGNRAFRSARLDWDTAEQRIAEDVKAVVRNATSGAPGASAAVIAAVRVVFSNLTLLALQAQGLVYDPNPVMIAVEPLQVRAGVTATRLSGPSTRTDAVRNIADAYRNTSRYLDLPVLRHALVEQLMLNALPDVKTSSEPIRGATVDRGDLHKALESAFFNMSVAMRDVTRSLQIWDLCVANALYVISNYRSVDDTHDWSVYDGLVHSANLVVWALGAQFIPAASYSESTITPKAPGIGQAPAIEKELPALLQVLGEHREVGLEAIDTVPGFFNRKLIADRETGSLHTAVLRRNSSGSSVPFAVRSVRATLEQDGPSAFLITKANPLLPTELVRDAGAYSVGSMPADATMALQDGTFTLSLREEGEAGGSRIAVGALSMVSDANGELYDTLAKRLNSLSLAADEEREGESAADVIPRSLLLHTPVSLGETYLLAISLADDIVVVPKESEASASYPIVPALVAEDGYEGTTALGAESAATDYLARGFAANEKAVSLRLRFSFTSVTSDSFGESAPNLVNLEKWHSVEAMSRHSGWTSCPYTLVAVSAKSSAWSTNTYTYGDMLRSRLAEGLDQVSRAILRSSLSYVPTFYRAAEKVEFQGTFPERPKGSTPSGIVSRTLHTPAALYGTTQAIAYQMYNHLDPGVIISAFEEEWDVLLPFVIADTDDSRIRNAASLQSPSLALDVTGTLVGTQAQPFMADVGSILWSADGGLSVLTRDVYSHLDAMIAGFATEAVEQVSGSDVRAVASWLAATNLEMPPACTMYSITDAEYMLAYHRASKAAIAGIIQSDGHVKRAIVDAAIDRDPNRSARILLLRGKGE